MLLVTTTPAVASAQVICAEYPAATPPAGIIVSSPIADANSPANLGSMSTTAIARIVNGDGTRGRGSLTIIDLRRGLMITSAHVVPSEVGATVYFDFPGIDGIGTSPRKGTVVLVIPEAPNDDENNGSAWGRSRDIAVVRATDPLPSSGRAAELTMNAVTDEPLSWYGFPGQALSADRGWGVASTPQVKTADGYTAVTPDQARCTRAIRMRTEGGDSGSGILNATGYLVGITSQAAQSNTYNYFIRADCFFTRIAELAQDTSVNRLADIFATGTGTQIASDLAMPTAQSRISNIEFYNATFQLVNRIRNHELANERRAIENLSCQVTYYLGQRGLRVAPLYLAFDPGLRRAMADATTAVAALQESRDVQSSQLFDALALYQTALPKPLSTAAIEDLTAFSVADAVTLKSIADVGLRLARLSTDKDAAAYAGLSIRSATLALALTSSRTLQGEAWATLGDALVVKNDPAAALRAYTSAAMLRGNQTPNWILDNTKWIKKQLPDSTIKKPLPFDVKDLGALIMKAE